MNPVRRPAGAVVEMRFAQVSYGSVDSCLPRHSACGLWLYTTEPYEFPLLLTVSHDFDCRFATCKPFAISQIAQVAAAIC
jgi:hypothetical protein